MSEGLNGRLRIGKQKGGTAALVEASGVLDDTPYAVEWTPYPAGRSLIEAIAAGEVDIGMAGQAPFHFAFQEGMEIQAVSALRSRNGAQNSIGIVVPPDSSVQHIGELAGKRIAAMRGSSGHLLLIQTLEAEGLTGQVELEWMSPEDAREALFADEIDAWAPWNPHLAWALRDGARRIMDGRHATYGFAFEIANPRSIADKPAIIADFLRREARALQWANDNEEAYVEAIMDETGLEREAVRDMIRKLGGFELVPIDRQLMDSQAAAIDAFHRAGEFATVRPIEEAFHPL